MTFHTVRRGLIRSSFLAALAFLVVACGDAGPQDTLHPEGPIAEKVDNLFKPVFWIAVAIFFIVEGLILYAVIKFRARPGQTDEPTQVHGNKRLEFTWTVIPAVLLAGIAFPTVATIFDIAAKPGANKLAVKVIGHQWWWEYQYQGVNPRVVTANELVIPVNKPVYFELESADVIHSFWVPKLSGKQDVVPGRTNTLEFVATKPGEYFGQCAEFCAISHANMRLRVHALPQAEFDAWLKGQQQPGAGPTSPDAVQGKEIFLANACAQCHTIGGTDAAGTVGPNLTHFASRGTLGSAVYKNDDQNLYKWIEDAPGRKAGVIMPSFKGVLTDEQIRALVAYLRSLR